GAESRGKRALEHPAGPPGIAADDHRVPRPAEDMARGAAEPERELRRQVEVRDATDAVGAEQPLGHLLLIVTVTRAGCRVSAFTPAGSFSTTSAENVPGPFPVASTVAVTASIPRPASVPVWPAT